MIKIGVLADTHVGTLLEGERLAKRLLAGPFAGVEMILHAGDHVIDDLDSCFGGIPYYGVCGNMDKLSPELPLRRIIRVGRYRIGMVHGWGPPEGVEHKVFESFRADNVQALVFGHSHQPVCRTRSQVLLLNPGSPTDRRAAPFHSVGLLYVAGNIEGEIIPID
ncbi:MAG: YfcE family phosphodiesterase [Desulfuromonadales bacterium]|nr:YfcE family phosphodiesterase [Desulfuromonadales bacterium]MBN2792387.1 YfcE family phosphodiesterase [Desulfuromonadales bacterium]